MSIHWTEETKAFVSDLYCASGVCSFADMAKLLNEKFGTSYTRNAVMGVSKRLGLKGKPPAPPTKKTSSTRAHLVARLRIVKSNHNGGTPRIIQTFEPAQTAALRCAEVEPRNLIFAELEKGDCRYPYGDQTFLFCGHPIQEDSSYCPAHHALCWNKPLGRRSMGIAA